MLLNKMLLKKLIIMLNMLLMFTVGIAAQTAMGLSEEVVEPGLVTDFASFTGIMTLISLVVTQLSKLIH